MAKKEVLIKDVKAEINALNLYRSGWANDIREGWDFNIPFAKDVLFELYEIAGSIILALQNVAAGCYRDKMAMILVRQKLEKLVKSDAYDDLDAMSDVGICNVITNGTRHHIRVMFQDLDILTA